MSGRSQSYKQHDPRLWTPLVDDAVFVEPPEDWIINLENFGTTLLQKPIRRLAKHPWTQTWQYAFLNARSSEVDKPQELLVEFRDSHLDGQVRNELEKNHEDAQAAKDLLLGDDIKGAWTNALRALPHVHTWRVATRSKEARFPIRVFDQRPNSMKPPGYHGGKYECHTYDEDLGDALFAAATRSLSEASLRPHEFIVDCVMSGHFGWETLRGWQQLDLSHLQSFHFQPAVSFYNEDFNEIEWEGNISPRAANAIAAVLRKCKNCLQELRCQGDCPLQWPGSETINLPELRCLVLQGCRVRPLNLGRWMARMPLLQNLEFELPMVCENDYSDFRSILDAVRNQSKGMRLRLLTSWTVAIDLDYHTHDVERILGRNSTRKIRRMSTETWRFISVAKWIGTQVGWITTS